MSHSQAIPANQLAQEMFTQNLWWTYAIREGKEFLEVSKGLLNILGRPISILEDIMGEYETELLRLKIAEAYKAENTDSFEFDMRFIASYETLKGKRSFQHQLRVMTVDAEKIIWVTCIDVSEMVALEREMVDAQGRLSLNHLYDRQKALQERNAFITNSYNKQSRFLALLSHELRSPLLGISSLVKRIRSEMDISSEVNSMLKTIAMTAEQSTYLVNDILTYSQTEYDGITLHPTEVSLSELLENVKQLTKSIASDKDLILSLVYLGEHERVVADGVRLTQILINLIVNAIKFTQYGGVNIEVSETHKEHFVFKITDSGEGITAERQTRIFEPFAQLEADSGKYTANDRYLGAGLGLFVVKQLVELMGGEITVTSDIGVGTSFEFELKLKCVENSQKHLATTNNVTRLVKVNKKASGVSESQDAIQQTYQNKNKLLDNQALKAVKVNETGGNVCRVLIADDSKINCMVLAGYLADLKCEVVEAKDGRQAWDLFQKQPFDYVLLDIQMPFMDGVEVSKRIQERYASGQAKELKGVFAITAGGDLSGFIEDDEKPENIGFDAWLVKPVNKQQIIQLLDKDYRHKVEAIEQIDSQKINLEEDETEKEESLAILGDVPKQFHHLLEPFIVEMNDGINELQQLNQLNDSESIKKIAHYLKGNCMLFQLSGLVSLFRNLESIQDAMLQNHELADGFDYQKNSNRFDETEKTLQNIVLNVKSLENSISISHNNDM